MNPNNIALETNVLIIGKTGVGKSSLINYIYPGANREIGTGRPVTKEGIFKETFTLPENGMTVHLYDTWGLEADKSQKWDKLIMDEVRKHDRADIKEWFHTTFYCINAKSARIEPFEANIIRKLNDSGNSVQVVLTNCDLIGGEDLRRMREAVVKACCIADDEVHNVASVQKKSLGGKVSEPFGRDRVIEQMVNDLWQRIAVKVPRNIEAKGKEMLNNIRYNAKELKDKNNLKKESLNKLLFNLQNKFEKYGNAWYGIALDYYSQLMKSYAIIDQKLFPKFKKMDFQMATDDSGNYSGRAVGGVTAGVSLFLGPLGWIFGSIALISGFIADALADDSAQDELEKEFLSVCSKIEKNIESHCAKLRVQLESGHEYHDDEESAYLVDKQPTGKCHRCNSPLKPSLGYGDDDELYCPTCLWWLNQQKYGDEETAYLDEDWQTGNTLNVPYDTDNSVSDDDDDIEIVELEDSAGGNEEFAILDEIDFEDRHFVVMAPLIEVKALKESEEESDEIDLSIEIYEVDGDYYTIVEDDSLAKRLMQHLEENSR